MYHTQSGQIGKFVTFPDNVVYYIIRKYTLVLEQECSCPADQCHLEGLDLFSHHINWAVIWVTIERLRLPC